MVRSIVKVLLVDVVLLFAEYLVLQDLQWRTGFVTSGGLSPSFSYGPLTQFFIISGRALTLRSPPTLDWLQIIIVILVLLNGWYLLRAIRGRGRTLRPTQALEEKNSA